MGLKKYRERKAKHSNSVAFEQRKVWGSMTWNGPGKLEFIDGIIESEVYVNNLNKNFLASTRKRRMGKHFIFQQDNDPKHTSKKAKEFFIRKQIELNDKL